MGKNYNQKRNVNQFAHAYTVEIVDLLCRELEKPSGGEPRAVADLIEELVDRGDTILLADALMCLNSKGEDFELQPRVTDAMLGRKEDFALLWGYGKCLSLVKDGARVSADTFITFEDYLSPNGVAARWELDAESMLATISDPAIAAKQDSSFWRFAKDRGRLFFTAKQRRTALFNKPITGDTLLNIVDAHLGKGASWYVEDAQGNVLSSRNSRRILRFTDQNALETARQNVIELVSGCNATQLANFKLEALCAFAVIMTEPTHHEVDGSIVYDLREERWPGKGVNSWAPEEQFGPTSRLRDGTMRLSEEFDPLAVSDLTRLAERGELGSMDIEVRRWLDNTIGIDPRPTFPARPAR